MKPDLRKRLAVLHDDAELLLDEIIEARDEAEPMDKRDLRYAGKKLETACVNLRAAREAADHG